MAFDWMESEKRAWADPAIMRAIRATLPSKAYIRRFLQKRGKLAIIEARLLEQERAAGRRP